jgi:hypothetical protein
MSTIPGRYSLGVYGLLFFMIAITVIMALLGFIDKLMARRIMGGLFGLILIVSGNFLPKMIRPWQVSNKSGQFQRLIGWILVLAGMAMVGVSIIAYDDWAPIWTVIIALTGLFFSTLIVVINRWQDRKSQHQTQNLSNEVLSIELRQASIQRALAYILHAMAWVCVMFAVEIIWGPQSLSWSLIGYALSLTLLPSTLNQKKI